MLKRLALLFLIPAFPVNAADYPDMVGKWTGDVRVVESGRGTEGGVARGGMQVRDVGLTVYVDAQEGETFIGRIRSTATPADEPSPRVWGTIRSTGNEAIFATSGGARGQIWFDASDKLEFCLTNVSEELVTAYCANVSQQKP